MKIQKSIWLTLLLIFCGIFYFLFFTYQNIQQKKQAFQWVNHTHEVIETIDAVRSALFDVESQVRGYAITANPVFVDHYALKKSNLYQRVQQLRELTTDNLLQQQNAKQLFQLIQQKIAFQNQIFEVSQQSTTQAQALIASLTGKQLTDSLDSILQAMQAVERQLLTKRLREHERLTQSRYITSIALAVAALLLLGFLLLKIARENTLRKKAEQLALESEIKYRNLIENSAVVVFTTDLKGNYTYLSGKSKEITGFTAEELVGEHYLTLVEDNWVQKVQEFYACQLQKRTPETTFEFPVIDKYGERKWIEQSVVLLENNGEPNGFQCVAKDITEKKYAEKLLAEAAREIKAKQEEYHLRLQSILDNMPMIVYLKDLEGNFQMVNKQFHEILATTDKEVIGKKIVHVHRDEKSARKFIDVDNQVKHTLQPVEVEDVVLTKEGERHMSIVKFPLLDKEGRPFAICAVGKDITEKIHYQKQLIEARERAEKAERLQEEFLANMSHEIRTPMNGVIGMADLMETTQLNGEQKEYLRLIRESSQILLALINDILDLSKIKAGRMTVERVDFNLKQTIESVTAPFVLKAKEKGISFTTSYTGACSFVNTDQHKLVQVLNNLLSNAVKFTEKGSVTLATTIEEKEDGALNLVCLVSDTGIGIAEEHLGSIFNSFVQAGNDMVRRFGGTGLGLAIIKRLIELLGGNITVCSVPGEGTTFRFQIPVAKSREQLFLNEATESQKLIDAKSLRFKKVLLVEDNEVNQKVTFLMLHKAGILTDIANNGREAIDLLKAGKQYDLIIMDLQMPEMDGFQTTQYLRTTLQLQTPIIAMTASALRNEKEKCLAVGMNEYLAKPFAPQELFFHLKQLLLTETESAQELADTAAEPEGAGLYNLRLLDEMEDAEYSMEVLQLFLRITPPVLHELTEKTAQQDWDEVFRKAHNLKSSLGLLQMNRMLDCVTDIERSAKTKTGTENIASLVANIVQQYQLVKPMLEAELEQTRKNLTV